MRVKVFHLCALIVLAIVCWVAAAILWGSLNPGWLIILAITCWLVTPALVLAARRLSAKVWILAGLLILAGLVLPTSTLIEFEQNFQGRLLQSFGNLLMVTIFLMPSMALLMAALLLYSGVNLYKEWRNASAVENEGSSVLRKHAGRVAAIVFALSALLLAKTLHNLYWLTVWDSTSDPIGYLWLIVPTLAALFSGVMLSVALPGRTKLAGLFYSLFMPVLMIAVSARAQSVDFRQLTEERAEHASQVIETYYAREGRYPQDLRQLTPWYIFSLPGPVIIYGQDWCYDGGDHYCRLGYVYREHWSDPRLTGKIFRTKGEVPDLHRMCEEEVVALQKRYPDYPYSYWMDGE